MTRLRDRAVLAALGLGLLGDLLLRVQGRPGLNAVLFAFAGTAALWWSARKRVPPVSRESRWLVLSAVGFSVLLLLRDSEALAVLDLVAIVILLGLAAGRGAQSWALDSRWQALAVAAARVGILIALGPIGWAVGATRDRTEPEASNTRTWRKPAGTLLRGLAMGLPPLLVVAALLSSADPVFAALLDRVASVGLAPVLEHLAFAAVLTWLASGYLRAALVRDPSVEGLALPRPALPPLEPAIALGVLALLFLAFLVVQARYLFGGASVVELTEGLGYAEYARRGFFELIAATAFVVPVLLLADWAAGDADLRGRRVLRAVSWLLVALLVGVLASAAWRMQLYQQAYGLTVARILASTILAWLGGVLAWLALTVLRGRPRRFVFGAIAGGLACLVALHAIDPDARVARVNLARAAAGAEYDGHYLRGLGADAVPALLAARATLPAAERCRIDAMLAERWAGPRPGGWRTWNRADAAARRQVANSRHDQRMDRPAAMACDGGDPARGVAGGVAGEVAP